MVIDMESETVTTTVASPAAHRNLIERPVVREMRFEDYAQIADLQRRNGIIVLPEDEWSGLWKSNPAYAKSGSRPMGWVLETREGAIVGSLENIPFSYNLGGRELSASGARGWVLDKEYRRYAMTVFQHFVKQSGPDFLLSTTVGPKAEVAIRLYQWARPPVGAWDQTSFWITDHVGFAKCVLSQKSGLLARLTGGAAGVALAMYDRLRTRRGRIAGRELQVAIESGFDSRFDDFWQALMAERQDVLLCSRSREALEWHFRRGLRAGRVWVVTVLDGERLVGYAVFDRCDNPGRGLKRMRLVDFRALRSAEHMLGPLVSLALKECRANGIHILECVGQWLDEKRLSGLPPLHRRTLPVWLYYYKANDAALAELLQEPARWAPSTFDGDASL